MGNVESIQFFVDKIDMLRQNKLRIGLILYQNLKISKQIKDYKHAFIQLSGIIKKLGFVKEIKNLHF